MGWAFCVIVVEFKEGPELLLDRVFRLPPLLVLTPRVLPVVPGGCRWLACPIGDPLFVDDRVVVNMGVNSVVDFGVIVLLNVGNDGGKLIRLTLLFFFDIRVVVRVKDRARPSMVAAFCLRIFLFRESLALLLDLT
jgi:hypothetical protein